MRNILVRCNNIKKWVLDIIIDFGRRSERRARKPYIAQEMISDMDDERR